MGKSHLKTWKRPRRRRYKEYRRRKGPRKARSVAKWIAGLFILGIIIAGGIIIYTLNDPPTAHAGGPYSTDGGKTVKLDGTRSSDPDGDMLTYSWTITSDPTGGASLTGADTATPTFHAPSTKSDTTVTISLTVEDDEGVTDSDTVTVRISSSYYGNAEEYVVGNYGEVKHQTRSDLTIFLWRLEKFPEYDRDEFSCSEASALLEWLLEGAGFNARIAINYDIGPYTVPTLFPNAHAWVVVKLDDGKSVNIEATWFTEGSYNPPAIVSGSLPTFWGTIDYDTPVETFDSLDDVVNRFWSDDGWDWWNVYPYSSMGPFSGWN